MYKRQPLPLTPTPTPTLTLTQALTLTLTLTLTKAARYFREMLKLRELQEVSGETQEALLFLAYYCKDTGELQEAQQHCSRLLDIGGQVRV